MSNTEKLDALAGWIDLLRSSVVDAERKNEATKKASKLASELFPPMAKALIWAFCDGVWGSGPYTVNRQKASCYQVYGMPIKLKDGYCFASDEAAKAACEAHHQARFLEQMA